MVAPTPKNAFFEVNYSSKSQPLFFEFNLEPTPVSFKPQPKLSVPPARFLNKRNLNLVACLTVGILFTAFIINSGILNNELFNGKLGNQASLGWGPSYSAEAPEKSRSYTAVAELPTASETFSSPEPVLLSSVASNPEPETDKIAIAPVTATSPEASESTEPSGPSDVISKGIKPIIKPPVSPSKIKLSEPVTNKEAKTVNHSAITSEDFHNITNSSAQDGKKVFIKFGAKWCLPCKMMETNVFPDPEIRKMLSAGYHTLDVDVDNIDGINLRQYYKVETLPSFVILDSKQNMVGKYEGAKRIEELRSILGGNAP